MTNNKRDIKTITDEYKSKYPQFASYIDNFGNELSKNQTITEHLFVAMAYEKSLKKALLSKNPKEELQKAAEAINSSTEKINNISFTHTAIAMGIGFTVVAFLILLFTSFKPTIMSEDIIYALIGILIGAFAFFGRNIQLSKNQLLCALILAGMGIYDGISKLINNASPSLIFYVCGMILLLVFSIRKMSVIKK